MNSLKPSAIQSTAINSTGMFYPLVSSKFVYLPPQILPGGPAATGQTCHLRLLVAAGKRWITTLIGRVIAGKKERM